MAITKMPAFTGERNSAPFSTVPRRVATLSAFISLALSLCFPDLCHVGNFCNAIGKYMLLFQMRNERIETGVV